jgi:hypothetical protein
VEWTVLAIRSMSKLGLALVAVLAAAAGCSHEPGPRPAPEVELLLAEMDRPSPPGPGEAALWRDGKLFDPGAARAAPRGQHDEAGRLWQRFRKAYPFGLQGIAVSALRADGSCSVVVAEPPPHVALDDLRAIIPDATVFRQPVGHDGALFDVAGNLTGGEERIRGQLRRLNLVLFRTEYQAFAYQEPFDGNWREGTDYHLDANASPAEVHGWVYAPAAQFEPVGGGEVRTRAELAADAGCGVYRLRDAGIVAWRIPQGISVEDCLPQIRVFALASDVVIGAVKDGATMVLGRQRIAPFDVAPPMRTETVALLAAVKDKDQLEQSYQRLSPGAGIYSTAWDWAPILLSPELVDTEYGHVLNVADQLLKGWTEHGQVTYERFDYRRPGDWPFEDALSQILHQRFHQNTLTFNWNTTGAGYVVRVDSAEVYTPYRTGALPVSYIPGEDPRLGPKVVSYEDRSYDWYAGLQNPTLARVVGYAALFQIFHNLGAAPLREQPPSSAAPARAYTAAMQEFWQSVAAVDRDAVHELATHAAVLNRVERAVVPSSVPMAMVRRAGILDRMRGQMAANLEGELVAQYERWTQMSAADRFLLEGATSTLDGHPVTPATADALAATRDLLEAVAAREKLADRYARSVPADGRSWIHTPLVVMSSAGRNHPINVGGHNVRANVTKLALDSQVRVGRVRLSGGVLQLNEADAARAPAIVRAAARSAQAGESPALVEMRLSRMLAAAEPRAPRPAAAALHLGDAPPPARLPPSPRVRPMAPDGASMPAAVAKVMSDGAAPANRVMFVKAGGHVWVKGPYASEPVLTSNLADASELASARVKAARGGGAGGGDRAPPELQFMGFSDQDRDAVLSDMRANGKRAGHAEDVLAVVSEENPGLRKLSSVDYDFHKATVVVEEPVVRDGETFSQVKVTIPGRQPGIKAAIVRFLIRIKGAIVDSRFLAQFVEAVRIQVERLCGRVATDGVMTDSAPWLLLHREVQRVGRAHGLEVEMHVQEEAGNWHLVLREVGRHLG